MKHPGYRNASGAVDTESERKELEEELTDVSKELHIYLRILPMTGSVREQVRTLVDRLASMSYASGYYDGRSNSLGV
jgi:hypothetical protein